MQGRNTVVTGPLGLKCGQHTLRTMVQIHVLESIFVDGLHTISNAIETHEYIDTMNKSTDS